MHTHTHAQFRRARWKGRRSNNRTLHFVYTVCHRDSISSRLNLNALSVVATEPPEIKLFSVIMR